MGWFDSDQNHWTRTGVLVGLASVIVAAVTLAVAFVPKNTDDPAPVATRVSATASTSEYAQPSENTAEPTTAGANEPSIDASEGDEKDGGGVASVHISLDDVVSVSVGKRVGPSKWELRDWGGTPTARISVAWESRTASNVQITSDGCEMLISMNGPGDVPSQRSAACSQGHKSAFSNQSVVFVVHETGSYVITVSEGVSGVESTAELSVVA